MPNCFDPDQDRCSVEPELGPNCLQRLSVDDKSPQARKELRATMAVPKKHFCLTPIHEIPVLSTLAKAHRTKILCTGPYQKHVIILAR